MLFADLGYGVVIMRSCHLPFLQLGQGLGTHETGESTGVGQLCTRLLDWWLFEFRVIVAVNWGAFWSELNHQIVIQQLTSDHLPPVWVRWIDRQAGVDCGIIITGNTLHHRAFIRYLQPITVFRLASSSPSKGLSLIGSPRGYKPVFLKHFVIMLWWNRSRLLSSIQWP